MTSSNPADPAPGSKADTVDEPTISHAESREIPPKWSAQAADGDTAMALFDDPDELHEEIDPAEARRLLWKIDFMILPYLAVCYAFFYIDKVDTFLSTIFLADTDRETRRHSVMPPFFTSKRISIFMELSTVGSAVSSILVSSPGRFPPIS